jgi:hypothetical protein
MVTKYEADIPPPIDYRPANQVIWWDYVACKRYIWWPGLRTWGESEIPVNYTGYVDQMREARGLPRALQHRYPKYPQDKYQYAWTVDKPKSKYLRTRS